MMASLEVFDRKLDDTNSAYYLLNKMAIQNFRASHTSTEKTYSQMGAALYVASAGGNAFGFVGPDNSEFYTAVADRFIKTFPATEADLPVLEIPARPISFTKNVM
jgi:hypothetical protein